MHPHAQPMHKAYARRGTETRSLTPAGPLRGGKVNRALTGDVLAGRRGAGERARFPTRVPMNHHAHPELDLMPPAFARGSTTGPAATARRTARPGTRRRTPGWRATMRISAPASSFAPGSGGAGPLHGRGAAARGRLHRGGGADQGGARAAARRAHRRLAGRGAGQGVEGCRWRAAASAIPAHGGVCEIRAVIGRDAWPGVDLVWDDRVLYAHVGLDLVGAAGGGGADRERGGARRHPPLHPRGPGAARVRAGGPEA